MIWFRTRGRFLFVERSSDAGAPPSLSQFSSALALLFGRFGCFSGIIGRCSEFSAVSRSMPENSDDDTDNEQNHHV